MMGGMRPATLLLGVMGMVTVTLATAAGDAALGTQVGIGHH